MALGIVRSVNITLFISSGIKSRQSISGEHTQIEIQYGQLVYVRSPPRPKSEDQGKFFTKYLSGDSPWKRNPDHGPSLKLVFRGVNAYLATEFDGKKYLLQATEDA